MTCLFIILLYSTRKPKDWNGSPTHSPPPPQTKGQSPSPHSPPNHSHDRYSSPPRYNNPPVSSPEHSPTDSSHRASSSRSQRPPFPPTPCRQRGRTSCSRAYRGRMVWRRGRSSGLRGGVGWGLLI